MTVFISAIGWQYSGGCIADIGSKFEKKFNNNKKEYCDCIDRLRIIPICTPDDHADMAGKESIYIGWKRREANFSLRISYDEFASVSYEGKKRIVVNHIAKCALILANRITNKKKGKFDLSLFLHDFLGEDYCLIDDDMQSSIEKYDINHQ